MVTVPILQESPGSLVMLEHVNITVGEVWTQQMDDFWFQVSSSP